MIITASRDDSGGPPNKPQPNDPHHQPPGSKPTKTPTPPPKPPKK